jgi:3-dehydroquinate dehydratase type I
MICVSIGTENYEKQLEYASKFDFVEYRIDLCKPDMLQIQQVISNSNKIILSFRDNSDLRCIDKFDFSSVYMIDIDYNIIDSKIDEFIVLLKSKLILSYHLNYFNYNEIIKLIENDRFTVPKIKKIAVHIDNTEELDELYSIYAKFRNKNLILIGMGDLAKESRIKCLEYGAPFTYASPEVGEETADGQYTYEEMIRVINA